MRLYQGSGSGTNGGVERFADPAATIAGMLNARQTGDRWMAKCPAHDDGHASLSIGRSKNGSALLNCQAGCATENVLKALGITKAQLFPHDPSYGANGTSNGKAGRRINATYDYRNAEGKLLYQAVRYEPKDFRQRRPDGRGGWIYSLGGVERVLYRLPELNGSNHEEWVFIPEGEKDVDRLAALGLVATTNPQGAGKWREDYSEALRSRRVVLLPDNDVPGRQHVEKAGRSLIGKAAEVRIVVLPDLPPKGDVSDWLDAGNTRDALLALVDRTPSWAPPNQVDQGLASETADSKTSSGERDTDNDRIYDPKDPLPTARAFRKAQYAHGGRPTLYHDGELFHVWDGSKYTEQKAAPIRAKLYPYLEAAHKYVTRGREEQLVPFAPNQSSVNNVMDSLASLSYTERRAPCWLSDEPNLPDPREVIPTISGLVRLREDADADLFRPPTPDFFCHNSLDFPFEPEAKEPTQWLRFLDQLWPDDREAIELLQEWFGYCLTPDTRQQKALMLVGPKRAGKGTIARVLRRVIGPENVCGPTLSSLSTNFGLWPLMGKLVGIISDARLSGRTDQAVIAERILAITGEDAITIDRKNLDPVTTRLPTRLMILTNELPRLSDASGALASRFIILTFTESFYGREDTELEERICGELAGILLWAIEGWKRLHERGHFLAPATSETAVEELNDLGSPISAFIRDWCTVGPAKEIPIDELFEAWGFWCRMQGGTQSGSKVEFGRDLRAAVPGIETSQPRVEGEKDKRIRAYKGIDLTLPARQTAQIERSARSLARDGTRATA